MSTDIGPAGYGNSSLIGEQSGLSVDGIETTIRNIDVWGNVIAYVANLTSKSVAESIMIYSNKILPFDTGELMDSGFVETVEGSSIGIKVTNVETDSQEGAYALAKEMGNLAPDLTPSFMARGGLGRMRTYTKYACGYTAEHAATVHENKFNVEWNPSSKTGRTNPFGDGAKRDHFLLEAYDHHKDKFSQAMKTGIEQANARIAIIAAGNAPKPAALPTALSSGGGRPRLIKR